jgi:hypothetical protein
MDSYWTAYERWKRRKPIPVRAADRWSREETHEAAAVRPGLRQEIKQSLAWYLSF